MSTNQTLMPPPAASAPNRAPTTALDEPLLAAQDTFARLVVEGLSNAEAYAQAYGHSTRTSAVRVMGSKLASRPHVARRIRELGHVAAERSLISIAARLELLHTIAHTPASEVVNVITEACPLCWSVEAQAEALGRYCAGKTPMPNLSKPDASCTACRGRGSQHVVITDTVDLSAAGRAIYRGAKQNDKGAIEVQLADRQAAIAELNRMQPGALAATRSASVVAHVNVPIPDNISAADGLAFLKSLTPS